MLNKVKLLAAFLLLIAGIAGFYLLSDKPMIVRILTFVAGLGFSVAVMWATPLGRQVLNFVGEAAVEARRVVWPTRKETVQTTLVVFVLVVVMAAFLAVVDIGFAYMVKLLMGRGA